MRYLFPGSRDNATPPPCKFIYLRFALWHHPEFHADCVKGVCFLLRGLVIYASWRDTSTKTHGIRPMMEAPGNMRLVLCLSHAFSVLFHPLNQQQACWHSHVDGKPIWHVDSAPPCSVWPPPRLSRRCWLKGLFVCAVWRTSTEVCLCLLEEKKAAAPTFSCACTSWIVSSRDEDQPGTTQADVQRFLQRFFFAAEAVTLLFQRPC